MIKVGSLVPVRDRNADTVFQGHAEYIPVEQPPVAHVAEQIEAEFVNSSEAEVEDSINAMVVHCNMIVKRFLPSKQPTGQQAPPSPPRSRKRPRITVQAPRRPEEEPL